MFLSLLIFLISSTSRVEFSSSRLEAGSSAKIISGSFVKARMTVIRCRSPPLSFSGNLLANFPKPKYLRSSCAFSFLFCLLTPARASGSCMFSETVRDGMRLKNWKINPMWCSLMFDCSLSFSLLTPLPNSLTSPWLGGSRSPTILRRVVLPTPDLPLTETNSPSLMVRSIPFNTSVLLNLFFTLMSSIMRCHRHRGRRRRWCIYDLVWLFVPAKFRVGLVLGSLRGIRFSPSAHG